MTSGQSQRWRLMTNTLIHISSSSGRNFRVEPQKLTRGRALEPVRLDEVDQIGEPPDHVHDQVASAGVVDPLVVAWRLLADVDEACRVERFGRAGDVVVGDVDVDVVGIAPQARVVPDRKRPAHHERHAGLAQRVQRPDV